MAATATGNIVGQPNDPIADFKINSFANQEKASLHGAELAVQHMFGDSGFRRSGQLHLGAFGTDL